VSKALEAGLSNGWDDWGEGGSGRTNKVQPWFDDGAQRAGTYSRQIATFRDAYTLLLEALDPLRAEKVRMLLYYCSSFLFLFVCDVSLSLLLTYCCMPACFSDMT
jgi:hypothetical protein